MKKPNRNEEVKLPKKQLINLTENQKGWLGRVVELAGNNSIETSQSEVIRVLVDQAMVEDPESFIGRLEKLKLKATLASIEAREAALQAEKDAVVAKMEAKRTHKTPAGDGTTTHK